MVTLQILVLSFLVRVRVSQLESIFRFERCFFRIYAFRKFGGGNIVFCYVLSKGKEDVPWIYGTPSYMISIKSVTCSLHQ